MQLPKDPMVDTTSAVLLDASILQLCSARMMLGFQVGMKKFESDQETYCQLITGKDVDKDRVAKQVLDVKQQGRL